MFAALVSAIRSLLAQPGVPALGAGLLTGVVAGTVLVASGSLTAAPPAGLSLVTCPGAQTLVTRVASGQQMLVTARSADGLWLQLYVGQPGAERGWAPATAVRFQGATELLPVQPCGSLTAVASLGPGQTAAATFQATVGPATSLVAGGSLPPTFPPISTLRPGLSAAPATPTPSPGPSPLPPPPTIAPPTPTAAATSSPAATPTPTPIPSPTPDVTGPTIAGINVVATQVGGSYYIDTPGNECGRGNTATISATVTDSSGVNKPTIQLRFTDTLGVLHIQQMFLKPGTKATYASTITTGGAWPSGEITWRILATDSVGNLRSTNTPPAPSLRLFRSHCFL